MVNLQLLVCGLENYLFKNVSLLLRNNLIIKRNTATISKKDPIVSI